MVGYVTLGTRDLARASAFYDALLGTLGAKRLMQFETFILWGRSMDQAGLAVCLPYDKKPATVGNGVMVALRADSKAAVDALHRQALALGGTDEGPAGAARRRLLRRLLPRPRRQQAERVLPRLVDQSSTHSA